MSKKKLKYKTKEEILEAFKKNIIENNIQGQNGYRKFNSPSINLLRDRCNLTFNQALEEVGLRDKIGISYKGIAYYKMELSKVIKKKGYIPTYNELVEKDKHYKFCNDHLKSTISYTYEKLLEEMGHAPKNIYKKAKELNLTKEETLNEYIQISTELGRFATVSDLNYKYNNRLLYTHIRKFFSSMDKIRKESGLNFKYKNYDSKNYRKEDIEKALKNLIIELGRLPNNSEILVHFQKNKNLPQTISTIVSYFGIVKIKDLLEQLNKTEKTDLELINYLKAELGDDYINKTKKIINIYKDIKSL